MKSFELTLRFPTGGVLIGGYSAVPDGLHGAHAVDAGGRPIVPATALRGALREALEAVLRGAGESACSGGDGVDPARGDPASADVPCTLDGGGRCKACRLFGSRRPAIEGDERAFSGLVLGDAVAEGPPPGWIVRPGVGLSRRGRSAEDHRLFMQRVPATPGQRFVARGRLLDPGLQVIFEAAVRATTHVGAGRSRGVARVEIAPPVWRDDADPAIALPADGDVRVRLTLLAPASIGVPVVHPNLRETREELPGAALRGAIGFALAGVLDDPDADEVFQELVSPDGASFGFLSPVDAQGDGAADPFPITAAACKEHRRAHGVVDTLLDRLAVALVTDASQIAGVERDVHGTCKVCGQPLRALSGWRRRSAQVATRTISRASLDRAHASARDGQLFTQVLLEAGTVFEGLIRNVPARGRAHLARALALPLSIGRGRSSGWGRVSVEVLAPPTIAPLGERAAAFDEALGQRLRRAGLPADRVGRILPVTLMSPLILRGEDDGAELLARALEARECVVKARRFSREGGWDQRTGAMEPALATASGGVFVLDLGRSWRDALPQIERIEQQGIGLRAHQGYGRVMAFDPMFREPR